LIGEKFFTRSPKCFADLLAENSNAFTISLL
jgi:hypothetical protein